MSHHHKHNRDDKRERWEFQQTGVMNASQT